MELRWVRSVGGMLVGVALLAASLTVLFLGMRDVMEVGGSCGSGGAYDVATPCPQGTWLVPVSIFTGIAGLGVVLASTPTGGPPVALLAWPALFLSLGWNFLEYGLDPPGGGGVEVGWLICAALFALMGGIPLWVVARAVFAPRRPAEVAARAAPVTTVLPRAIDGGDEDGGDEDDLVARLERLMHLHRSGGLTDEEFTAAKWALLEDDR